LVGLASVIVLIIRFWFLVSALVLAFGLGFGFSGFGF
jgi:hypothetical protein